MAIFRSLDGTESVRFGELVQLDQTFSDNLETVLKFAREQRYDCDEDI